MRVEGPKEGNQIPSKRHSRMRLVNLKAKRSTRRDVETGEILKKQKEKTK